MIRRMAWLFGLSQPHVGYVPLCLSRCDDHSDSGMISCLFVGMWISLDHNRLSLSRTSCMMLIAPDSFRMGTSHRSSAKIALCRLVTLLSMPAHECAQQPSPLIILRAWYRGRNQLWTNNIPAVACYESKMLQLTSLSAIYVFWLRTKTLSCPVSSFSSIVILVIVIINCCIDVLCSLDRWDDI
jgi:hypothetical protein